MFNEMFYVRLQSFKMICRVKRMGGDKEISGDFWKANGETWSLLDRACWINQVKIHVQRREGVWDDKLEVESWNNEDPEEGKIYIIEVANVWC